MANNRKIFSNNKPALGDAFKHEEVKEFLYAMLKDLTNAHSLKHFLTVGHEEYYKEQIKEISKHFYVLEVDTSDTADPYSYKKVRRCIDGQIFTVGDRVMDIRSVGPSLPIGRLYEDERGLHVRLDVEPDGKCITWRDLSSIEHDLPF